MERPTFPERCPLCRVPALVAQTVRSVNVAYLDGTDESFHAALIIQCRACGAFLVGSTLMQQLRLIPRGGES